MREMNSTTKMIMFFKTIKIDRKRNLWISSLNSPSWRQSSGGIEHTTKSWCSWMWVFFTFQWKQNTFVIYTTFLLILFLWKTYLHILNSMFLILLLIFAGFCFHYFIFFLFTYLKIVDNVENSYFSILSDTVSFSTLTQRDIFRNVIEQSTTLYLTIELEPNWIFKRQVQRSITWQVTCTEIRPIYIIR